jgi:cation transport ATPase
MIQKSKISERKPIAYTLAPAFIVILVLTGIPILLIPVVQVVRGETVTWSAIVPIGTITALLFGLLAWLLATIRIFAPSKGKDHKFDYVQLL